MTGSLHKSMYFAAVFVAVLMSAAVARADIINSTLTMRAGLNDPILLQSDDREVEYFGPVEGWGLGVATGEAGRWELELESATIGWIWRPQTLITAGGLTGWPGFKMNFEGHLLSLGRAVIKHDVFLDSTLVGSLGPFTGPAFHARHDGIPLPSNGDPFSLTHVVTIAADKPVVARFDADLTPTPEPATMLLVGAALLVGAKMTGRFVMRR